MPETFWYIFLSHTRLGEGEETSFNWRRGHLFDMDVAVALYQGVLENPRARVTKVIQKITKKWCVERWCRPFTTLLLSSAQETIASDYGRATEGGLEAAAACSQEGT